MRFERTALAVMSILFVAGLMTYLDRSKALRNAQKGWDLVPIVVASEDIEEGATLTTDMIAQGPMPRQFVTASVIKPESYSYVIGQKVVVSLKKGDPLMWFEFMCPKFCGQRDGSGIQVESQVGPQATVRINENKIKHVEFDFVNEALTPGDGGRRAPESAP